MHVVFLSDSTFGFLSLDDVGIFEYGEEKAVFNWRLLFRPQEIFFLSGFFRLHAETVGVVHVLT